MPLILIGPAGAGKTTVGQLLATSLGRAFVDLDEAGADFYEEVDRPVTALEVEISNRGFVSAHRWWQPARVHAVSRVLAEHPGAVIAFGAGHSHYEDRRFFEMVRALVEEPPVVLLLPDPDPGVALHQLRERCVADKGHNWLRDGEDFLEVWMSSEQNRVLADIVVYSSGRRPAAVADAIVAWLNGRS